MMQLVQTDPRFMDVFSTITGIDLMKMQEEQLKKKDRDAEDVKKAQEEKKKKDEEEIAKQKEAEYQALS